MSHVQQFILSEEKTGDIKNESPHIICEMCMSPRLSVLSDEPLGLMLGSVIITLFPPNMETVPLFIHLPHLEESQRSHFWKGPKDVFGS